jgi:hypothetical protein
VLLFSSLHISSAAVAGFHSVAGADKVGDMATSCRLYLNMTVSVRYAIKCKAGADIPLKRSLVVKMPRTAAGKSGSTNGELYDSLYDLSTCATRASRADCFQKAAASFFSCTVLKRTNLWCNLQFVERIVQARVASRTYYLSVPVVPAYSTSEYYKTQVLVRLQISSRCVQAHQ